MAISNRLRRKAVGSRTRGQTLHTINEILVHSREDKDLLTSPPGKVPGDGKLPGDRGGGGAGFL